MARRVLVVDDDDTVSEVVVGYLERADFEVERTRDGEQALRLLEGGSAAGPPDLVVLDVMLPGMDGLEVCRRLHESSPVPIIMLTALGEESDRIAGLERGADDYVTKPFSPRELVLRVESVLRRTADDPAQVPRDRRRPLRAGTLVLDPVARRVTLGSDPLLLTAREFDLLAFLLGHPGQPFSRAELMERVWGWTFGDQSTVTVHVRRLREKIEVDPANPVLLVTVWGVGYRMDAPVDAAQPASESPT